VLEQEVHKVDDYAAGELEDEDGSDDDVGYNVDEHDENKTV
jgi:hypothetical protein